MRLKRPCFLNGSPIVVKFGCIAALLVMPLLVSCTKEVAKPNPTRPDPNGLCAIVTDVGTPYALEKPFFFPEPIIPPDNPLTEEGVELGRYLFWDKALSRNGTVSCGSCHFPEAGFADSTAKSMGLYGGSTVRNSMPLFNLAWNTSFFWDGGAPTLEQQILAPVVNPVEMDMTWAEVVQRVRADTLYDQMFAGAFGNSCVDSVRITYAIAQFLRTMVSADSYFDRSHYGPQSLTPQQQHGLELFLAEGGDPMTYPGGQQGGDCFHCHGGGLVLFTDQQFHNNGIDTVFADPGLEDVTGSPYDLGKFHTPTLRNVALTAPYMHDGRFATLKEVVEHYNSGGHASATLDPLIKFQGVGLGLSEQDVDDLVAFLNCLTDTVSLSEARLTDPR